MFESISKKVLKEEELAAIRQNHPDNKIVFCTGCFDILQSGHAVFLTSARHWAISWWLVLAGMKLLPC